MERLAMYTDEGGTQWFIPPAELQDTFGVSPESPDVVLGNFVPDEAPQTWKVVGVDNYARDYIADRLYIEGYPTKGAAQEVADRENAKSGPDPFYYYRVFPACYRLNRGMEDLV